MPEPLTSQRVSVQDVLTSLRVDGDQTRQQLAERLGNHPTTVRYHLRLLIESQQVMVTRRIPTKASDQKVYGVPRRALPMLARHEDDPVHEFLQDAMESALGELLDRWGAWTQKPAPSLLLERMHMRILKLPTHEQAALAQTHDAAMVWRFARVDLVETYRSAVRALLWS